SAYRSVPSLQIENGLSALLWTARRANSRIFRIMVVNNLLKRARERLEPRCFNSCLAHFFDSEKAMSKGKPPLVRLCELMPRQSGDFFALLAERVRGARKDGKPFFTCRFRDHERAVTFMAWSDGPWFEACETQWREGQFYKIRGAYDEHKTYGPQIDIKDIRVIDDHKAIDFDPIQFVDHTRRDVDAMFGELCAKIARAHV